MTCRTRLTLALLVILTIDVGPGAQNTSLPATTRSATLPPGTDDLAQVLAPIRKKYHLVALGGAIVQGDRLVAIGAVGHRKKGSPEKVTIDDPWHLGSDTKAMTATLCAMLVEQGKLRWDSTVAEVFPESREKMHADFRDVTLEQLLQHRAGLPHVLPKDFPHESLIRMSTYPGEPRDARHELMEQMLSAKPDYPAGTKIVYSNFGYVIAGAMTEKVTNQSWEKLTLEMIFVPLGMSSAGFGAPGQPGKPSAPWGHVKGRFLTPDAVLSFSGSRARPVEPGPNGDGPPVYGPAFRVHCSLEDWGKFVSLHLSGETTAARLLKPETFKKLHGSAGSDSVAMGWGVRQRDWGGRVLTHAGSNNRWFAVVWASPEKSFAVLVTTNQAGGKTPEACDEAAVALIHYYQNHNP
jgi:CubicO group peptidase (beta-lactamase class C family)